jgi:hypothetical protein
MVRVIIIIIAQMPCLALLLLLCLHSSSLAGALSVYPRDRLSGVRFPAQIPLRPNTNGC